MGDMSVEALFPEGRERFELGSSGWSRVLGIDAVGGPPYCDFADEGGAQMAWHSPNWLIVGSGCEVANLAGEVGDVLCSLGQVVTPDGMVLNRAWNLWEPRQRTWVGRRQRWEAPVEDGGHVSCGREIATAGGFL
jgi:hypothetical protein